MTTPGLLVAASAAIVLGLLGALFLGGYLVLARAYFFSTRFRCLAVASMLYGAGFAAARG